MIISGIENRYSNDKGFALVETTKQHSETRELEFSAGRQSHLKPFKSRAI